MRHSKSQGLRLTQGTSIKVCTLLLFLLLTPFQFFGQKQGNIWYFGGYAGLDFNESPPQELTDGRMDIWEGCASVADASGKLVFYTDGMKVWNRNHNIMPNGVGLLGNPSSTQSGVIVPKPGSQHIYYIFSVEDNIGPDGLTFSEIDMSLDEGLGDVVVETKNTRLFSPASEKITAVQHKNGKDIWVITHPYHSDQFYCYLVTTDGFDADRPVISTVGSEHTGYKDVSRGYMKASHDGTRLALALEGKNRYELFDFDNETGIVSNPLIFPSSYPSAYGVEFSPNGRFLYGSERWGTSVHQFDLWASDIPASGQVIATLPTAYGGALQLANDRKIYLARREERYLGVIEQPDELGMACNYIEEGFVLSHGRSEEGLPNFISSFFSPTFKYNDVCLGEKVKFSLHNETGVESLEWSFNYPSTDPSEQSSELAPEFLYTEAGEYTVQLVAVVEGISDTVKAVVNVFPLPEVDLGDDRDLCEGETLLGIEAEGTFSWSTGSDAPTIKVSSSGNYTLNFTDEFGCKASDAVNITVLPAPAVTYTTQDVSIPNGTDGAIDLSVTNGTAPYTYQWSPSGATTQDVNSLTAEVHSVTVTDHDGCFSTSKIYVKGPIECAKDFVLSSVIPILDDSDVSIDLRTNIKLRANLIDDEENLYLAGTHDKPFSIEGIIIDKKSFLLKFSPTGQLLNVRKFEYTNIECLRASSDNTIHAAGFITDNEDIGEGITLENSGIQTAFTASFDKTLETLRASTVLHNARVEENFHEIILMYDIDDEHNEYILTQTTNNIVYPPTITDNFLYKRDVTGSVIWQKHIKANSSMYGTAIDDDEIVNQDIITLALPVEEELTYSETSFTNNSSLVKCFILQIDPQSGDLLSKQDVMTDYRSVVLDGEGGYFPICYFSSGTEFDGMLLESETGYLTMILHYDKAHTLISRLKIETDLNSDVDNLLIGKDGKIYLDTHVEEELRIGDTVIERIEDVEANYLPQLLKLSKGLSYLDKAVCYYRADNSSLMSYGNKIYDFNWGEVTEKEIFNRDIYYLYTITTGGGIEIDEEVNFENCTATTAQISIEATNGTEPYTLPMGRWRNHHRVS